MTSELITALMILVFICLAYLIHSYFAIYKKYIELETKYGTILFILGGFAQGMLQLSKALNENNIAFDFSNPLTADNSGVKTSITIEENTNG